MCCVRNMEGNGGSCPKFTILFLHFTNYEIKNQANVKKGIHVLDNEKHANVAFYAIYGKLSVKPCLEQAFQFYLL